MGEENEKLVIDFKRKETEANWIKIFDSFGIRGAPVWFDWLEWVLVIGAFRYLFEKTKSLAVIPIICISGIFIVLYFNAFFFNIEFRGIPFLKRFEHKRWSSLVLSGFIAYFSINLAMHLALAIAKHTT